MKVTAKSVRVATEPYEFSHGKMPRGRGGWMFEIGTGVLSSYGLFSECKREAQKIAAKRGEREVRVMP